jgi:hypothetical protein
MNGWLRLWILLTAIWAVIVIGIVSVVVVETYDDAEGPWIAYSLSEKSKPFFQNLEADEKGPAYTVEFTYKDGTVQGIRFPMLEGVDLIEFQKKINKLAANEGKEVSEKEIRRFLGEVSQKNSEAKSALAEYQQELERRREQKINDRKQAFFIGALVLVIPPIIILVLGYGIAWVRKGFA